MIFWIIEFTCFDAYSRGVFGWLASFCSWKLCYHAYEDSLCNPFVIMYVIKDHLDLLITYVVRDETHGTYE